MKHLHILVLLTLFLSSPALTVGQESTSKSVQLAGLREQVSIRRDERGIPYVEAKNDEDLYFGQGYAIASDRLWQLDLFRRTARGELAEILGAGPNNLVLEQDKQHRTLGFAKVAEAEFAQASPQSQKLLEAYAAGVNAYINSLGPKTLPSEFQILKYQPQPWRPADSRPLGLAISITSGRAIPTPTQAGSIVTRANITSRPSVEYQPSADT